MGARKRRSFSAGYLDKGEMNLFARPASRNVLTKEWIISMREKGVIISDAELRYRKWIALSNSQSPCLSSVISRPVTAPPTSLFRGFRENKCSKLRRQNLPDPHAEISLMKLSQQKRRFEKQCRSFSPMTIKTESFPQDDATPHQFLIGSRYNYSHIIDSRSLSRLGVYVPRSNLGGTFINPAGILPQSAAHQYGRVDSVISPTPATVTHVPKSSLLSEVQTCIRDRSNTSSTMNLSCNTSAMDGGSCITIDNNGTEMLTEKNLTKTTDELSTTSSNIVDDRSNTASNNLQDNHETHDKQSKAFDQQLMVSPEAAHLAQEILEESLMNDNDQSSDMSGKATVTVDDDAERTTRVCDDATLVATEVGNHAANKDQDSHNIDEVEVNVDTVATDSQADVLITHDANNASCEAKSSSTLIVDMTQLQLNGSSTD